MSIGLRVLGVLVVGCFGQMACDTEADAAQGVMIEPVEVSEEGAFCGGIAAIPCPKGLVCEDDPSDSCDPDQGGANCGGLCVEPDGPKRKCNYDHPLMDYVSKDPMECTLIDFTCAPDSRPFFNACGCGCKRRGNACDYKDPNRLYVARDPDTCARIRFSCVEGTTPFFDECGCGCEITPSP